MPELAASLDPALRPLLEAMNASGMGSLAGGGVEQARAQFRLLTVDAVQDEHRVPVDAVEDLEVDGADGPIAARAYRPAEAAAGPVGTIVFFHGGGFVIGDIETHDNQARRLCSDVGAVVLSVAYRLVPEHPWSVAAEDCAAATRWAFEHIDALGGDADRVAVAGDSAGGHCATVVAQMLRDDPDGPRLAAQLLIYPAVDISRRDWPSFEENAEGYFLTREDMEWFESLFAVGADPESPRSSPLLGDLEGLPPAVVVTAELDPLRDPGNAYAAALADAGVPVEHRCFDGLIHGFYGLFLVSPGCAAAVEETNAALRSLLRS
jgi:acetyl esterase/lipase